MIIYGTSDSAYLPPVEYRTPIPLSNFSKLTIIDGIIYYKIYQQDGSMQDMNCADTLDNRYFVSWVQIHDQ